MAPEEDLEPEEGKDDADDEPSLGAREVLSYESQASWAAGDRTDLEQQHDGREPIEDPEYTFGARETPNGPARLGQHGNEGEEPELGWTGHGRGWTPAQAGGPSWDTHGDAEPTLGACETGSGSQPKWTKGYTSDDERESACEDEGAQCEDEGAQEDRDYDELSGHHI